MKQLLALAQRPARDVQVKPIEAIYLPCISPISPLHLPYISLHLPTSPLQVKAIEALAELFLARLLPPRRLRTLEKQPLGAAASERQLLQAWFEEGLKHIYAGFARLVIHGTQPYHSNPNANPDPNATTLTLTLPL